MIPNWVFLAIPIAALALIDWLYETIAFWREERTMRFILDGPKPPRYHHHHTAKERFFY